MSLARALHPGQSIERWKTPSAHSRTLRPGQPRLWPEAESSVQTTTHRMPLAQEQQRAQTNSVVVNSTALAAIESHGHRASERETRFYSAVSQITASKGVNETPSVCRRMSCT